MTDSATLVWFRTDLRTTDQPALREAAERGGPVIPVYVHAPDEEGDWPAGAASNCWLSRSLQALAADLKGLGSRLIIRRGPTLATLQKLIRETGAKAVYWNRRYELQAIARDAAIKKRLCAAGTAAHTFNASLLFEPWTIQSATGGPYRVFTPFLRKCLSQQSPPAPVSPPARLSAPAVWPGSLAPQDLKLEPVLPWDAGIRAAWQPGAAGAAAERKHFLKHVADYEDERNRPDHEGTSRLSPYLHFGEIGPREVWHAVESKSRRTGPRGAVAVEPYLRQLVWREFAHHLLYHFPQTASEPLREEFRDFPWNDDPIALRAWQRGLTGFPYIDAGMRQLWSTGWMHNRVRMAVASFLVKDLLIPWQAGARWFWDTLVDADLANNTLGWQWTAGCGADAAPYFRVFNPVGQGERFDPEGAYIRRWVPELARLPTKWIHEPSKAPATVLESADVRLGENYPRPIVDHGEARKQALAALAQMKRSRA